MATKITYARPGYDYTVDTELSVRTCPVCSILYAIPTRLSDRCRERGESWYCPNGHSLHFIETDLDRERKARERLERQLANERNRGDRWRDRAEHERRSAIAYKGHLTRIRRRIANGICPVPGCKRSGFQRVMAHIASQHPDWLHDHAHELDGSDA
jgi:hypothetical protein